MAGMNVKDLKRVLAKLGPEMDEATVFVGLPPSPEQPDNRMRLVRGIRSFDFVGHRPHSFGLLIQETDDVGDGEHDGLQVG